MRSDAMLRKLRGKDEKPRIMIMQFWSSYCFGYLVATLGFGLALTLG